MNQTKERLLTVKMPAEMFLAVTAYRNLPTITREPAVLAESRTHPTTTRRRAETADSIHDTVGIGASVGMRTGNINSLGISTDGMTATTAYQSPCRPAGGLGIILDKLLDGFQIIAGSVKPLPGQGSHFRHPRRFIYNN